MKNLDQINIYSKRYRKIKFLNEEECNEFNDECNDHNNHISNYKDKEKLMIMIIFVIVYKKR